MSGQFSTYTDDDFLAGFLNLLPDGPVWPKTPAEGSDAPVVAQVSRALIKGYTRNAASGQGLLKDAFPVAPVMLLQEWEATLGLPDPCAGESPSIQVRQQQVAARFVASGGQSRAYFIKVAAALGYDITITPQAPSRFGRAFGAPFGGTDWAFTWQVNYPQFTITPLAFGSQFGQPFATWGNTVLQCELNRLKPAHTIIIWNYQGFYSDGGVLALFSPSDYPQSPANLPAGSVFWNRGIISVVAGIVPNPVATPLYFGDVTPDELLISGGGNLPLANPGPGTKQLWNNGGVVSIA